MLDATDVGMLLVSEHFLDSDFSVRDELACLLAAAESRQLRKEAWVEVARFLRDLALLPLPEEGWAAVLPDGRYKLVGDLAGRFWHVANLCRFEPDELAPDIESRRPLPLDAVIL